MIYKVINQMANLTLVLVLVLVLTTYILSSREKAGTVLVHACVSGNILSANKYIIISFRYNRII